ncbi:MAG TPA: class II aldolase [Clostridiaceae bacterium]|nr:class II aldolase [Clostridiaceae bacterium]
MKQDIPFVAEHRERLERYVSLSAAIGARVDYVQGGGGNTSVKLNDSLMAIKASGYKLSDIGLDKGYAVMSYQPLKDFYLEHAATDFDDVEASGAALAKAETETIPGLAVVRPSVEAGFHAILERYVAHSHSVYSNLAACTQMSKQVLTEIFAKADYRWGLVPYTNPGARLAFAIREERDRVKSEHGIFPNVMIMQNHGLIVSAEEADQCLAIHEDANRRMASFFNVDAASFPAIQIAEAGGRIVSATPFLRERLASGRYDEGFFERTLLYPDQQVFLENQLAFGDEPIEDKATIHADGSVTYRMPRSKAEVIEETLASVIFIIETIEKKQLPLSVMGQDARSFIGSWESEKYRQQISEQST